MRLGVAPERRVQHDGLGLVLQVENARNPTRSIIDVRDQVEDDFGFIRQADLGQIIDKVRASRIMLRLERENGFATLRGRGLLPEGRLIGTGPLMDKLTGLLQQQHAGSQSGGIDLGPLRRRCGLAVQTHGAISEIWEISDVAQLPLLFVPFLLPLHHHVGRFGFQTRHLDSRRGRVVLEAHGVLVGLDHPDVAAFLIERDQLAADDRDDRNITPVHLLLGFQFLDRVDRAPVEHRGALNALSGVPSLAGRAALGDRVLIRFRPIVQQHFGRRGVLQPVVFRHAHGAGRAFVSRDPGRRRDPDRRELLFAIGGHRRLGITALVGVPRHVVHHKGPLAV